METTVTTPKHWLKGHYFTCKVPVVPSYHNMILTIQIQIQIPLFSIKHSTMFLAYISKYTYNENMKKRRTYM